MGFNPLKAIGGAVTGFIGSGGNPLGAVAGGISGGLGGSGGSSGGSWSGGDWANLGIGIGEKLYDNYTSAQAASKAFDQQKWMASNAYQLKVQDLKKAGLNPALAYGGGGAQFPGVNMARTDMGGGSSGIQRMASAANVRQDTENKKKIEGQIDAEIANTQALTENVKETLFQIRQLTDESKSRQAGIQLANQIAQLTWQERYALVDEAIRLGEAEALAAEYGNEQAKVMAELWGSAFGKVMPFLDKIPGMGEIFEKVIGLRKKKPATRYRQGNRTRRGPDGTTIETYEEQTDGY